MHRRVADADRPSPRVSGVTTGPHGSYSSYLSQHAVVLRSVRMYLALGVAMLLGVGVVIDVYGLLAVDPRALRFGLAAAMAGVLGGTFVSAWVRARIRGILLGLAAVVVVWLGALLALNDFSPTVAVLYFTMVHTGGALLSIASREIRSTLLFLGTALVVALAAALASADPVFSPWLFLTCLGASSAVVVVSVRIRGELTESVERGRRLYREAEVAGGIGSWTTNASTGRTRWSEGLYRLLELDPGAAAPRRPLADHVHPDDRDRLRSVLDVVGRGDLDSHAISVRLLRASGDARTLRGVVRAERDASGQVARVVGVGSDVTEQAAHQAELVDALDRASAAARLKEAILANMSHEIRTPLTAVIGYAELLAEVADHETIPLVEPIVTGGQRLLDTLNSVLDLARLESDGAALTLRPVGLAAAAEVARAAQAVVAASAGLSLAVEAHAEVWALGDGPAIGRVLDNLVSNALRFTDVGGVAVRLSETADRAVLEVVDTGRGMSSAFRARAVEAFVQESAGDARSHEGSGLGLAIVRRLVEAMHGTLEIESAPGAGTTVRVALPRAEPEARATASPEPVWVARRRLAPIPPERYPKALGEAAPSEPAWKALG